MDRAKIQPKNRQKPPHGPLVRDRPSNTYKHTLIITRAYNFAFPNTPVSGQTLYKNKLGCQLELFVRRAALDLRPRQWRPNMADRLRTNARSEFSFPHR